MNTTLLQLYELLGAIYSGLLIGIAYTLVGIVRLPFYRLPAKKRRAVLWAADILYYFVAAAIFCGTQYVFFDGEVKLYLLLTTLIGALLYMKTTHALIKDTISHCFPSLIP